MRADNERRDGPVRPTLPGLTILRFFAALHVVAYHALRPELVDAGDALTRFLAAGPTAVTLFFVLSGFVLTWAHGPGVAPRPFFRARFARLAPVYWLSLILVLPLGALARARGLVDDPLGPVSFFLVATGLQAWVPEAALRWNPPAWSLSCELFFYALFPWLVARVHAFSLRGALGIGAAAWLMGLALPAAYLTLDPDSLGVPRIIDEAPWLNAVKLNPLARLPDFVVGVVAGRLFADGVRAPLLVGALAAIGAASVASMGVIPEPILHNGALAPAFAVLVVALASTSSPAPGALALLVKRPLLLLGEASYALYLLHVPLFLWTMAFTRQRDLAPGVALVVGLVAVPLSVTVFVLVERPLRERLRRDAS